MDDITTLPLVITIHFLHYIFKLLTAENLVAFESDSQTERRVCSIHVKRNMRAEEEKLKCVKLQK